jgi:hypothetical protein
MPSYCQSCADRKRVKKKKEEVEDKEEQKEVIIIVITCQVIQQFSRTCMWNN